MNDVCIYFPSIKEPVYLTNEQYEEFDKITDYEQAENFLISVQKGVC